MGDLFWIQSDMEAHVPLSCVRLWMLARFTPKIAAKYEYTGKMGQIIKKCYNICFIVKQKKW